MESIKVWEKEDIIDIIRVEINEIRVLVLDR